MPTHPAVPSSRNRTVRNVTMRNITLLPVPTLHIVAHHKAGEHVAWATFATLCCPKALTAAERLLGYHLGMCLTPRGSCTNAQVALDFNGAPLIRSYTNHTYVHFIRHPVNMLVSGYLYHRRCPEAWTKNPKALHTPGSSSYWDNKNFKVEAALFFGGEEQRLYLAEMLVDPRNVSERNLSYCRLLQKRNETIGMRAEVFRSLHAADGIRKMLVDRVRLEQHTSSYNGSGAAYPRQWFGPLYRPARVRGRFGALYEVCLGDVTPADSRHATIKWSHLARAIDALPKYNVSTFQPHFMGMRHLQHRSVGSKCTKRRLARLASDAIASEIRPWLARLHGYRDGGNLSHAQWERMLAGPCEEELAMEQFRHDAEGTDQSSCTTQTSVDPATSGAS